MQSLWLGFGAEPVLCAALSAWSRAAGACAATAVAAAQLALVPLGALTGLAGIPLFVCFITLNTAIIVHQA